MVAGAGSLPERLGGFDAVASGLVINFLPDPSDAVQEMRSRTTSGGLVAGYVWDYADKMEFLRYFWDVAVALDPAARELDEGVRFPFCGRDALEGLFADAGLDDVSSGPIDIDTRFASFADFWEPFLGGTGPAPLYVSSLGDQQRRELRDRLESALPTAGDGTIDLIARAWAVRGRVA